MKEIIEIFEEALNRAKELNKDKSEVKEPGAPFCPRDIKQGFFFDGQGVWERNVWSTSQDKQFGNNGFVFATREQGEKKFQRIKAILHFERLAEDLNEGWTPDWDDWCQVKYTFYIYEKRLSFTSSSATNLGLPYFKSHEVSKTAASKLSDDEIKSIYNVTEFTR